MEGIAILRRVVEAVLLDMGVIAKVLEAGVASYLLTHAVLLGEEGRQLVARIDVRPAVQPPGPLAHAAIRVLHEGTEWGKRDLLAVPFGGHGGGALLVFGPKPLDLRIERDVLLPE